MKSDLDQKLISIFSIIFDVSKDLIDDNFTMESSENWDSINQLNLILSIEEEFGIFFNDTEVPKLNSFKTVRDCVHLKISE